MLLAEGIWERWARARPGWGLWCSADWRYGRLLEGLCECVLGLGQATMLPAPCRHPPLPSCHSWQALLGVCSRCLWFISAEVLSSSRVLIEWGLGAARGSCDEVDRDAYPAPTFTPLQLPSHLLPLPSMSSFEGQLHPLPAMPLSLPPPPACALMGILCGEEECSQPWCVMSDPVDGFPQALSTKNWWEKPSLEASLPADLSGWLGRQAACLSPCFWHPLSTVSCAASFPNLQISCFQTSLLPLWGPSVKYASFRNPSDSLFSLS